MMKGSCKNKISVSNSRRDVLLMSKSSGKDNFCLPVKRKNKSTLKSTANTFMGMSEQVCCKGHGNSRMLCTNCFKGLGIQSREQLSAAKAPSSGKRSESKKESKTSAVKKHQKKKTMLQENVTSDLNNIQKYTRLKLKESKKSNFFSTMKSPEIKTAKKQFKKENIKKTSRINQNNISNKQNSEELKITEINPFLASKIGSPTFIQQYSNSKSSTIAPQNGQKFSFQVDSQEQNSHNKCQQIINDLKQTNQQFKKNLFQSYEKFYQNMESNQNQIKYLKNNHFVEKTKLKEEIFMSQKKIIESEKKYQQNCEERKKMQGSFLKKIQEKEHSHREEIKRKNIENEKNLNELESQIEERATLYSNTEKKLKLKEVQNEELKQILENYKDELRKANFEKSKLIIDKESLEKKIEKMGKQNQFIRKNSQTVLQFIQKEIQVQNQTIKDLEFESQGEEDGSQNKKVCKLLKQKEQSFQKPILGIHNYY